MSHTSAPAPDDAYAAFWQSIEAVLSDRASDEPADTDAYTAFADSADL